MNQTDVELRTSIGKMTLYLNSEGLVYHWPALFTYESTHSYLVRINDHINDLVKQISDTRRERKKRYKERIQGILDNPVDEIAYRKDYHQNQQKKRDEEAEILQEEIEYKRSREIKNYQIEDDDLERMAKSKKKRHMHQNRKPDPSIKEQLNRYKENPKPAPRPAPHPPPRVSEQEEEQAEKRQVKDQAFYAELAKQLNQVKS